MKDQFKREALKGLLLGKPGALEAFLKLQGPKKDYTLLTESELAQIQQYEKLSDNYREFNLFSISDMKRFRILLVKATPEVKNRHLLDRVDLTALNEEEMDQAYWYIRKGWGKASLPEWLQE